jgi:hypothetical protein
LLSEASSSNPGPSEIAANNTVHFVFELSPLELFERSITGSFPNTGRRDIHVGHLLVTHSTFNTNLLGWGR